MCGSGAHWATACPVKKAPQEKEKTGWPNENNQPKKPKETSQPKQTVSRRGAPWAEEEDDELEEEYERLGYEGLGVIAGAHGRTKGAIYARLQLLGILPS